MKPVVLTRHAEAKLIERRINVAWVEEAVRNPAGIEPEPRDLTAVRRFSKVEAFGGRYLRVVCVETSREIRVITATFDRGARPSR